MTLDLKDVSGENETQGEKSMYYSSNFLIGNQTALDRGFRFRVVFERILSLTLRTAETRMVYGV